MLAIPFLERLTYKNDIDSKKTQIEGLKGVEIIVDDYYNSVDKVKDVNNFVNMTVSPNDYILEFIKALEKGMPSHISVRSLSINNGQVSIAATTSTKQTVAKFITQLKSIPGIQNPVVPSCAESKDGYGVISTTFSVSFTFNADIVKYLEDKPIEGEENSEATEEEVQ
jgi:hypothetical protein